MELKIKTTKYRHQWQSATIYVIIFLLTHYDSSSQHNRKIDSLKILHRGYNDEEKFDLMLNLVREYAASENNKEAIKIAKKAQRGAYISGDSLKIVQSGRMLGQLYNRESTHNEAMEILLPISFIALRNNYKSEYTKIINNLAIIHTLRGEYDKALKLNFITLNIKEQEDDEYEISISLTNIGLVYYKLGNFKKAIEYYRRSLLLKIKANDYYDYDRVLLNISLAYIGNREIANAKKYLDEFFLRCKGTCSNNKIIEGQFGYGRIYFFLKDLQRSDSCFLKSYYLSLKENNIRFQLENIVYLSSIYISQGNFQRARYYLNLAFKLNAGYNSNVITLNIYKELIKLELQQKKYNTAAHYQNRYIHLKDSLYGKELTQNLMAAESEYEQRENKAKLDEQTKSLEYKEKIIYRQKWLSRLAIITSILLLLLTVALYRSNLRKKKLNITLERVVNERTRELRERNIKIEREHEYHTVSIQKIARDIKNPISTLKGLYGLAAKNTEDGVVNEGLKQMNSTIDLLTTEVYKLESAS
jgi:tetratricopeptide (TPR) repeat protein